VSSAEPAPRQPHLRAVPAPRAEEQRVEAGSARSPVAGEVEAVGRAVAEAEAAQAGGSPSTPEPVRFAAPRRALRGLGAAQSPEEGFGTVPSALTHATITLGSAAIGAGIGGLASGSWRGAGIGALANLSVLGLSGALLGAGRLSTLWRILYGVLALGAGAGAGYLVWRRMR